MQYLLFKEVKPIPFETGNKICIKFKMKLPPTGLRHSQNQNRSFYTWFSIVKLKRLTTKYIHSLKQNCCLR